MTLVETRRRGPGFLDRDTLRKAVTQRIANNIVLDIPVEKTDPECINLCVIYGIGYDRARLLKALSFGISCDIDLLAWAAGVSPNTTYRYQMEMVARHVAELKARGPRFPVEKQARGTYIITDLASLHAIRSAMECPP